MKKLLTLAMVVFAAGALRADLLYFMANAYTGEAPNLFDYAMVGVRSVEDGKDVGYLQLKSSYDASETADILLTDDGDRYHATGWADFGDYAKDGYLFYVAGFTFDGVTPLFDTETTMSYSDLVAANHVYVPGATNPQDVTMWVVPEPTSGLLFLLGLASLALRRKKMGKFIALSLVASSFSLSAFAAPDDLLVSFSTKGPDTYLDGTVVKDGECYALVWTKTGATFGGFAADGTLVGEGSKVLVFAPLAKGGRCPSVLFELDAEFAAELKGGEYALYLLDTRLAGGRLGGVNAKGVPQAVNGYGEVKVKSEGEGEGEQRSGSGSSVCVTAKSAVPADAPEPRITAIKLVGDKVFLTVKNTIPCLQYVANEVKVEGDSTSQTSQTSQTSTQGASSVDEEITVIAPKNGDSGFFSVGRE